jgi:50S ribosomal protein L16 3-hydroxylase
MKNKIPGGLSTAQFLKEYWHKKPLLIRNAFPGFAGLLNKNELISLSCREETQSRLVRFSRQKWTLDHGPFKKKDFVKTATRWTLLVQEINHILPEAQALLQAFNFIPHARLDDLMVSFATDGSGVGPHVDSYDVFLLQGSGKRLWQISKQQDLQLKLDAPLKILKNFKPEEEWLLEPGDMLYLPPHYAHNGIAVGECMTYSIGFRAPSHQEIMYEFLSYLQENVILQGRYADPDLKAVKHPAYISEAMTNQVLETLKKIRFGKKEVANFLGEYLSSPKAHVFFNPPNCAFSKSKFLKAAQKKGICLDLKSQMLFTKQLLFMNGETYPFHSMVKSLLEKLADDREVSLPDQLDDQASDFLYEWYLSGYLDIKK